MTAEPLTASAFKECGRYNEDFMTSITEGLAFATAASISNVMMDTVSKKALDKREFLRSIVIIRLTVASLLTLCLLLRGASMEQHSLFQLFAPATATWTYLFYLAIGTFLVSCSILLYYRAIQISPLSLTIPFLAFTPLFLLATDSLISGHKPHLSTSVGVFFIVLGSLLLHAENFHRGLLATLKGAFQERGSRYMLGASFVMAITNAIDKKLVAFSNPLSYAWSYAIMCFVFISPVWFVSHQKPVEAKSFRGRWLILAGLIDTMTLLLYLSAMSHIEAVVTVSIKRSGMLLAVLSGWFFFKEKAIRQRLLAACVLLVGALMLYLPFTASQQIFASLLAIGIAVVLLLQKHSD